MPGWEQLGMQAASQTIGGALGLILGGINDRRQLRQQEKLQQLQIRGSKELTDYNAIKQMEMWRNTSYPAQMEMLKKAGLNPALIYGSSGPGGMTNLATGNVASGNAPTGGGEIQSMMGMGLMNAMQAAQIENIKANTEKTKAETGAVAPSIEKTQAETKSITQGIENQKAAAELIDAQRFATNVMSDINARSSNSQVALAARRVEREIEEITKLLRENKIGEATIEEKIQQIKYESAQVGIENVLKQAQTAKTHTEIFEITKKIINDYSRLQLEIRDQENRNQQSYTQWMDHLNDNGFPKEISSIVGGILGGIFGGGVLKGGHNTIPGFQIPKK